MLVNSSDTFSLLLRSYIDFFFFFFQAEDGIRDLIVTGVQTCALPISRCGRSHQSLFSNGRNAFFDADDGWHLSEVGKAFIAGQLRHAREISAVFAQDRKSVV